jgi:hypothetical protein
MQREEHRPSSLIDVMDLGATYLDKVAFEGEQVVVHPRRSSGHRCLSYWSVLRRPASS